MEFRFSIKEKRVLSSPPPPPCDETKTRNGRNDKNCGSRTSNVPEQSIKFSNRIYHWALVHQTLFDINKNSGSSVRWIAVIAAVHFSPLSFPLDSRPFPSSIPLHLFLDYGKLYIPPSCIIRFLFCAPFRSLNLPWYGEKFVLPFTIQRSESVGRLPPPPWNRINEGRFRS